MENENFIEFIKVFLPTSVTIIGLFLNYLLTIRNISLEIRKQKNSIFLEKLAAVEYDLTEILQLCILEIRHINLQKKDEIYKIFPFYIPNFRDNKVFHDDCTSSHERIYRLFSHIFVYGSTDAVQLINLLQQENQKKVRTEFKIIALVSLIVTQTRVDATGNIINPIDWIIMKMPHCKSIDKIIPYCKEIIKNYNLKKLKHINW